MKRLLACVASAALVVALAPAVLAEEEPRADAGKRIAELPAEEAVRDSRSGSLRRLVDPDERVAPGVVRWHDDLTAARAASRRSARPVLLFQLLGRLDEEFC